MGQIPRSIERISSFEWLCCFNCNFVGGKNKRLLF